MTHVCRWQALVLSFLLLSLCSVVVSLSVSLLFFATVAVVDVTVGGSFRVGGHTGHTTNQAWHVSAQVDTTGLQLVDNQATSTASVRHLQGRPLVLPRCLPVPNGEDSTGGGHHWVPNAENFTRSGRLLVDRNGSLTGMGLCPGWGGGGVACLGAYRNQAPDCIHGRLGHGVVETCSSCPQLMSR
jgi:hypothetical protein